MTNNSTTTARFLGSNDPVIETSSFEPRNGFGGDSGSEAIDAAYVIISTFIIFTMQSGFGLLESGMVSRKSESNVMVKNMLDVVIGGFGFWSIGYSFAFGDMSDDNNNSFVSTGNYFVSDDGEDSISLARYFLQLAFSTTSVTIVSGAVAERIKLSSYMVFIFIQSTFIYAFPAHWMWHGSGWLKQKGAFDFAGGSVVHMTGGASCLIAAIVLGPRHGRFSHDDKETYGMACPTNVILGTFFLWWGWIGFNCGSTFAVTGGMWRLSIRAGVSTMNGAVGGGMAGVILNIILYRQRKYILDIPQFASAILGGLVSVTAGAAVIESWHAVIIGFIGGLLANGGISFLNKIHIDDPVGCFGVHWVSGFWGMIATGLFANPPKGYDFFLAEKGVFYGGSGNLLAYNIGGSLAISAWAIAISIVVFLTMKATFGVRIGFDKELLGSDEVEHNIIEYVKTIETKHVFGKHVVNKNAIQQHNGMSSTQIGPNGNSVVLVLRGQKEKEKESPS
ncbi:putative ammonium transporter 3 [Clytia hemisphaerica]|uniref:Ammonium transporter n=1 Tax=Clytia hemisphaerica TaxID=252671 RepID=A0A7M5XKB6_9CNID